MAAQRNAHRKTSPTRLLFSIQTPTSGGPLPVAHFFMKYH